MPTLTWKSSIEGSLAVHNVLILFKKYKKEGTVICFLLNIFVAICMPNFNSFVIRSSHKEIAIFEPIAKIDRSFVITPWVVHYSNFISCKGIIENDLYDNLFFSNEKFRKLLLFYHGKHSRKNCLLD